MKKYIFILSFVLIIISACNSTINEFSIDETRVGKLSQNTKISELSAIYANDSIATNDAAGLKDGSLTSNLFLFDNNGKQLLRLRPKGDSTQTIGSIRVYDTRFTTSNNISIGSSYKELKSVGTIDKILPAFNSISITIKGSSIYYTINRNELPDVLKYDRSATIEAIQIPDQALISNIMIQW